MDQNRDGTLSRRELRHAVPLLCPGLNPSQHELDVLFDDLDPDDSGTIE